MMMAEYSFENRFLSKTCIKEKVRIWKFSFSVFLLFLSSQIVYAQTPDSALARYSLLTPEKVWMHLDKAMYAPGETIWFKAYLLEGIMPGSASKSLYTDWTDEKGKLLHRSVSPLVEGVTSGQFDVPSEFKGKAIHLRSYTRWMLNFDSSFFYEKDIPVISTSKNKTTQEKPIASIQFFPEGGDAIVGIPNKIAFKANDQFGNPVSVKGVIVNNKKEIIDSIRTQHDGMGFFFLTPANGEVYTANWQDDKNQKHTTTLPDAKQSGVSLQVSPTGDRRQIIIRSTPDYAVTKKNLQIIGTMNNITVFRFIKQFGEEDIKAIIPAKDLISGILTITVLDENWKPLTERITYIDNGEYVFQPNMEVSHWGLNKRARNEITISVPENIEASLSISVTDLAIGMDTANNIISQLMLNGDLKGEVHNPSYYFSGGNARNNQHLDLVMLTHGWRRFKWDEIAMCKMPEIKYPRDTTYLALTGRLLGLSPERLKENLTLLLITKPKTGEGGFEMLGVNADGSFGNPNTILFDTTEISYGLYKAKGNTSRLSAQFMENKLPPLSYNDKAVNPLYDTTGSYLQAFYAAEEEEIFRKNQGIILEEVTVQAKVKSKLEEMDEKYANGLFTGNNGYSFDLVNDPLANASQNIFTFLQGRVPGLQIMGATSTPTLNWRGGSPQMFLNEMPVDVDMISSISVNDVAFVKVFRPPFMGASGGGAFGAIAIYTRRGDDVKPDPSRQSPSATVIGYSELRQFYVPNYSSFKKEHETRDIRTTLYWNPNIVLTPASRTATVTFYNNDISNAFRVVIEGMTTDGRLAHIEQIME